MKAEPEADHLFFSTANCVKCGAELSAGRGYCQGGHVLTLNDIAITASFCTECNESRDGGNYKGRPGCVRGWRIADGLRYEAFHYDEAGEENESATKRGVVTL